MIAIRLWVLAAVIGLPGYAATVPDSHPPALAQARQLQQLHQLLPADAILLGEQHDAPDHQRIHRFVVQTLASQHALAALGLEMASQGQSTEKLGPDADEDRVRAALQWDAQAWPWAAYGPVVMAAVRAGVPVVGANLSAARLRAAMADTAFDRLLPGPALKAQQQNIRRGHCDMLPESQITPMTRIQIARDVAMAQTVVTAARPGKTVVLLAGRGHVNRTLGVAQHLPPGFRAKTVLLSAEPASEAIETIAEFDQVWFAKPAPVIDYCAKFSASRGTPAAAATLDKLP